MGKSKRIKTKGRKVQESSAIQSGGSFSEARNTAYGFLDDEASGILSRSNNAFEVY